MELSEGIPVRGVEGPLDPDGPLAEQFTPTTVHLDRPYRFSVMAPGWMPPESETDQSLGFCFTKSGEVVLVAGNDDSRSWSLPGGGVEAGETPRQTLHREVAEEACCRVMRSVYLVAQHVYDPEHPDGPRGYYQTRWWARVEVEVWRPRREIVARRFVGQGDVVETMSWTTNDSLAFMLDLAIELDRVNPEVS